MKNTERLEALLKEETSKLVGTEYSYWNDKLRNAIHKAVDKWCDELKLNKNDFRVSDTKYARQTLNITYRSNERICYIEYKKARGEYKGYWNGGYEYTYKAIEIKRCQYWDAERKMYIYKDVLERIKEIDASMEKAQQKQDLLKKRAKEVYNNLKDYVKKYNLSEYDELSLIKYVCDNQWSLDYDLRQSLGDREGE